MLRLNGRLMAAAAAVLLAAALTGTAFAMAAPNAGAPGTEELYCSECGMRVDESGPFACRIALTDGKTVWFCDIGDMMIYYDKRPDRAAGVFVKEYPDGGWTDGAKAYYVTGSGVRTPMGYGIAAFGSREKAEEFRTRKGSGRVLSFDEAIASKVFRE